MIIGDPVGYLLLIEKYDLRVIPNWHRSYISAGSSRQTNIHPNGDVEDLYPSKSRPTDTIGGHLEFAIKHDGINLGILVGLFKIIPEEELIEYIKYKPSGKYARIIWFLYEYLTNKILPIEDLQRQKYVDILDRSIYLTADLKCTIPVKRQRVNNNLIGNRLFCPIVRLTDKLVEHAKIDYSLKCQKILGDYSYSMIKRATMYLYTKETKSSYAIEHETPSSTRTERFVSLLHNAQDQSYTNRDSLINLQNHIVDARYINQDYRTSQIYVGVTVNRGREIVHYVGPKPNNVPELMEGLIMADFIMERSNINAVIRAAVTAYGFVFIHPFDDGNGRIHRFLIHNILSTAGFTPHGSILPISAYMVKHPSEYDASLEAFSKPLKSLIEYMLDQNDRMIVQNDTADLYRYMDLTTQAEALFEFVKQTIDTEFVDELNFLQMYDVAKTAIQNIVDMPDQRIDLFIKCCEQNGGKLSKNKRCGHFSELTDTEITNMEQAINLAKIKADYGNNEI